MPETFVARIVLPSLSNLLAERGWVAQKLVEIAWKRWHIACQIERAPLFADYGNIRPCEGTLILLTPSFLLHEDPPWEYFRNLAESGRAVSFEEAGSGIVLAAAFGAAADRESVGAWMHYLGQTSGSKQVKRPPLPRGGWVLHESGKVSDQGFAADNNPLDDMRRARNLPAVNQLVRELSEVSGSLGTMRRELAERRAQSGVPWLFNSLLNEVEHRTREVKLESQPREFHISTTSGCNIECRFCSYTHKSAIFRYLDWESFLRLDVYAAAENVRLSSGLGEPTLNPHLPAIMEHLGARYPHLNLNVFTNGVAWSKPGMVEAFSNLSWLNASLNATTDETWKDLCLKDGFGRVRSNLLPLRKQKEASKRVLPYVYGSIVLNVRNIVEFADLPYLCAELGIVRLTAIPFFALGYEGGGKLEGNSSLAACKHEYASIFERAVRAAEAAKVSLEAPPPDSSSKVDFGVRVRDLYDFGNVQRAGIKIEKLLPDSLPQPSACPSLWRLSAVASTSHAHARNDVHGYLYPCLGPLASHDFSVEMPVDYSGRAQYMEVWNGARYQRLRAGQSERGLSPTCDACGESDSRNPENFAMFLRLRSQDDASRLVQLRASA